jgi:hypothetical protein
MHRHALPAPDLVVRKGEAADELGWKSMVDGDPDLARIERTLSRYGPNYVDQFAKVYVLFNNKAMLPAILNLIIESARQAAAAQDSRASLSRGREDAGDRVDVGAPRSREAEVVLSAEKPISTAQSNAPRAIGSSAQPGRANAILPAVRTASEQDEQLKRAAVDLEEQDNLFSIFEGLEVRKR